jgi:hypothetical protein
MQKDTDTARRFLFAGATALPVGLALTAVAKGSLGSIVTLIAISLLIGGLHTFGRAGPDPG